jgi:hypothetical protein
MSRGFLIIAQNTDSVDYVRCAAALASSIKQYMPKEKVALATMDLVVSDYAKYFDKIVELPYGDLEPISDWKLINDWQAYDASPFNETIKLEADMYIPRDISHWFNVLSSRDVVVCSKIRNFKQEISTVRAYRKFIDDNQLPDVYNAITYFKKSHNAERFFTLVRHIFENWSDYRATLKCNINEPATTDWVYSIACHIMGVENTTLPQFEEFSMIHMKQYINGLPTENWTNILIHELLPHTLRVNTVPQQYPFHYVVKDFAGKILCQQKNL